MNKATEGMVFQILLIASAAAEASPGRYSAGDVLDVFPYPHPRAGKVGAGTGFNKNTHLKEWVFHGGRARDFPGVFGYLVCPDVEFNTFYSRAFSSPAFSDDTQTTVTMLRRFCVTLPFPEAIATAIRNEGEVIVTPTELRGLLRFKPDLTKRLEDIAESNTEFANALEIEPRKIGPDR